ncbi:MAG: hypothetical protein H6719_36055, partial [Sandaracinaceae bacterium]|nr:hypothetical protein [Sandaracinaceae bacterium]
MHALSQPAAAPGDPTSFVYGGVAFDFAMAPGLPFELVPQHRQYIAPADAGPVALSVSVAVAAAPELAQVVERDIHAHWDGSTGSVSTRGARAEIRQLAPRTFAASGLVSPDASGVSSLCTALAGTLIDRIGGVVLHASGVELDDGVYLFIGPSGAGKTTAANHCEGARAFARDRAAIYPTASGWHVSPMSGGDEIHLPPSLHRTLPIRGVMRVLKTQTPSIQRSSALQAVRILRESAQMTDRSPAAEAQLLDRL